MQSAPHSASLCQSNPSQLRVAGKQALHMQLCSRQPAGHATTLHADVSLIRSCMCCRAERLCYAVAHGGQIVVPFSIAQAFVQYCVPDRPQMKEETLLRNASERRGQVEAGDLVSKGQAAAAVASEDGPEVPNSPQLSRLSQRSPGVRGWQPDQPGIELTEVISGRASGGESLRRLWQCSATECSWACS